MHGAVPWLFYALGLPFTCEREVSASAGYSPVRDDGASTNAQNPHLYLILETTDMGWNTVPKGFSGKDASTRVDRPVGRDQPPISVEIWRFGGNMVIHGCVPRLRELYAVMGRVCCRSVCGVAGRSTI